MTATFGALAKRVSHVRSGGVFYGWRIVSASFFIQFMATGTTFYSYGVLLKPLSEGLGASRFAVGLALPMFMLIGALTGPLIGRELDRRGARGLMLVGSLLMSFGFVAFSQIDGILGLYVAFGGFVSLGAVLLGPLPNTALVANWFQQARGTALGISQIGVSLSGMFMAFIATWLVVAYGWRGTVLSFALVPLVLIAPVVLGVVVNRPQDRGLLPDGRVPEPGAGPLSPPAVEAGTLREALRERNLWLIALLFGLNFAASGSVIQVIHSHATDLGHSATRAASCLSLMAGMAALGKPLFGALADRISPRSATAISIAIETAGLVSILMAPGYAALLGASIVFGIGFGGMMPLFGMFHVVCFGGERLGRMMGATFLLMLPFQLMGLPFVTAIFDRTGSYAPAFLAFLGLYVAALIVLSGLPSGTQEP